MSDAQLHDLRLRYVAVLIGLAERTGEDGLFDRIERALRAVAMLAPPLPGGTEP